MTTVLTETLDFLVVVYTINPVNYECGDNKLELNLGNHKVHFSAAEEFEWASASIEPDTRKDYGEQRFIAYGMIGARLHCLIFTMRNDSIRLISLRKANQREVSKYVDDH